MAVINVSNKVCIDVKVREYNPFEICFDLSDSIEKGLTLDTDYNFIIKIVRENIKNIKLYDTTSGVSIDVIDHTITITEESNTIPRGVYYYELIPVNKDLDTYITLTGEFDVA